MSEGEHGAAEQRPNQVSAGRAIGGGRSVSPAKRRADDMEGSGGEQAKPPGSFPTEQEDTRSQWDVEMKELASQDGAESQVTVTNSLANSRLSTNSVNTSATSLDTEPPPPYSKEDNGDQSSKMPVFSTEEYDQQYAHVLQLANKELDEGTRGVIVSRRWLDRVRSRSTQGLTSKKYPKEAREGPVGPLDNSDLLPEDAFTEPHLQDAEGARFVPLKPGLAIEDDYQPLPMEAYDYICTTYGSKHPHSIRRYAHNTAPPEATQPNIQYETYPPVITIRKVPQPGSDSTKHTKALEALKARKDLAHRGQKSSDDAPRLVSSKSEKYQKFLRRAKEAAGIPIATKVKVWRVNKADDVSVDRPDSKQPGVLSPPASRDASPDNSAAVKLVVSPQTFSKMEVGVELEATEGKDETNNDKYNGRSTMELVGLFEDSTIILEEQTGGPGGGEFQSDNKKPKSSFLAAKGRGSTPASTTASGRTSPAPGMVTRGRARKDGKTRGVTGLTNLGNTCYMNSALQCIRSVEELAIYFLTKKFKSDINDDNPLGYHGAMAHAYANVLEGIYGSGSTSTFSPNEFKRKLGTYQPMFSGYGQQDSQEFLSFLVDALHEDLNRIRKKPYIENPDSDDARVHDAEYIVELGEIYRNNHRQRNDSIAMDLFSGFYKNTMECPTCDKVSVTFDPYSLVTVQLPMEITLQHNITYVPLHGKPVIHELDVDKNWTIKALKDHLAKKHAGASANAMWMAEVYNHQIFKVFDDASTIAETNIQSNDFIWIYELEQAPKNNPKKVHQTSLFSRDKINIVPEEGMDSAKADVFTVPIFNRTKSGQSQLFSKALHPLYITLTREEAKDYEIILKKVLIAVANITSRPILTEFDEELKSTEESGSIEEVDAENDTNSAEDAAGVSDHSAQSEEGYVNVSLDKSSQDTEMTNGGHEVAKEMCDEETPIPAKFMDPRYVIPQALRSHLFEAKYVPASNDNMFLAGSSGYTDGNLSPMLTRVKRPSRRSSVQSSSSDESSTSSASQAQTEDATDDSDSNGIDDKPDLVLGDSNEQSNDQVEESDDELAGPTNNAEIMEPSPVDGNHRSNRRANKRNRGRGKGKRGKGRNRNGPVTYSKQDKARYGQTRGVGGQFAAKRLQDEDSPYYIQIGEGIVLDWRPEAFDSLFEGDGNVADDMRGHRYVDDNGKQGRIFPDPEQDAKRQKREQRKKHGVDLDDCFDVTRRREILSEGNEWYCNRCKEMRQAAKTLEIWTLPDILVVHLKRFGGNRSFRDKIDLLVDYPVEGLDMNDKVGLKEGDKDYTYDLFAVDLHFGGLGGGHYTAYVKNFFDGEWYDCNDSSVYKLGSTHKIQSAAAYLLFYRRRSDKPLGPQALQDLVEEYRNPPTSAEEADDEDSGEGRLGGPSRSSPHGSPSVLAGAEAGAKSHLKGLNGSGGAGRANSLTTRATETTDLSGMNDGGWSFDGLKQPDEAGTLLDQMQDDNASTTAEMDDRDSALGSLISDGDTYNTGVNNSPIGATFVDVNAMDAADDPDTAIISLDENSHDKMD